MTKKQLEEIKQRHLRPELWKGRTFYEGHIMIDMLKLLEEIARLKDLLGDDEILAKPCLDRDSW